MTSSVELIARASLAALRSSIASFHPLEIDRAIADRSPRPNLADVADEEENEHRRVHYYGA